MDRRNFILATGTMLMAGPFAGVGNALALEDNMTAGKGDTMFGLIGKFTATVGQRDALIDILLEGLQGMPGCISYIVARDPADATAIWVTEVWDNADSHKASLTLPSVQAAIAKARPMIAGMQSVAATEPVGGVGLG
ncbi:putative quinol monooxygenase [Gimibacter soli]|uniref:Quinol monooxygenase n=1 Tax=Gimibacter soli TaxID=3024400 RepID=A0AAF0BL16_9PROT|nr:putative quinol monooxygenase [Gimibacter soli]WCL52920.1 putative quinol monooxygenase [Gimibacter soli]